MITLHINVRNKIATSQKREGAIVCGNNSYQIKFTFDDEWSAYEKKTARFIFGGRFEDVEFTGDTCPVPILSGVTLCKLGVYAGDLCTTTPAFIECKYSILCQPANPVVEKNDYTSNEAKKYADEAKASLATIRQLLPSAVGLRYELNPDKVSYSVTGIGTCTDTDLSIPDTYKGLPVTAIGWGAFTYCNSLTSVIIPDSVTKMEYQAFFGCANLTSVTIGNGVQRIEQSTFYECTKLKSVIIPDSVTSIDSQAFYDCDNLENITIPASVTSIGAYAFQFCYALASITIPDSVTSIGNGAFFDCDSLTSVTIGNGVQRIEQSTFYYCDNLTSVTIGNSVTIIEKSAFSFCHALKNITIPDGVTSIGEGAFYDCYALKSVTIGNGIQSIAETAFSSCTALQTITIQTTRSIEGEPWGAPNAQVLRTNS